ncbi:MAG: tRNA lysidine(34) synthetase TilS [Frankia sp.]
MAELRTALRRDLSDLPAGSLVFAACSGGPDSTALTAALAFIAPKLGLRAGLLTVDHAWYDGSRNQADQVASLGRRLGLAPVEVLAAPSARSEGAARDARRAALLAAATAHGAVAVLLGHTLDDQAETVLLRLARGSGARSLAGMPRRDGLIRRPLLDVRRAVARQACIEADLDVWDDPTNRDPAFARARVRHRLLPELEAVLGPGVTAALARTADLLRDDADALDAAATTALAGALRTDAVPHIPAGTDAVPADTVPPVPAAEAAAVRLDVAALTGLSAALRSRVLRRALIQVGCPPTALTAGHVRAVDDLVTRWRGQRGAALPAGVTARRTGGRLTLRARTDQGAE